MIYDSYMGARICIFFLSFSDALDDLEVLYFAVYLLWRKLHIEC